MLNRLPFMLLGVFGQKKERETERKQKETEIEKKKALGTSLHHGPFYRDYVRLPH